jgi:hypothetical protein
MKSLLLGLLTIDVIISGALEPKCSLESASLFSCEAGKASDSVYFYYNSSINDCVVFPCNLTNETLSSLLFDDVSQCRLSCKSLIIGGCSGTRHGCCPDGVTAKSSEQDSCALENDKTSPTSGIGVPHVLIIVVSVTGGAILLLLVLSVVGVGVMCRRRRRRNEERVVNNLLRMYEDAYDTSSSSDEDDSEDGHDSARLL